MDLIYGNFVYFAQTTDKMDKCNSNEKYGTVSSICFLLIVFGYVQGAYYLTIFMSVSCLWCNGQDPMRDEREDIDESDLAAQVNDDEEAFPGIELALRMSQIEN